MTEKKNQKPKNNLKLRLTIVNKKNRKWKQTNVPPFNMVVQQTLRQHGNMSGKTYHKSRSTWDVHKKSITLTGLSKEESEDLSNLKQDVVDTVSKTGLSKEKISRKYWQITQGSKNRQNKKQNTIIKFKAHSFKERNLFKWKIIKRKHFKNQTVTC